jgi:hypothetical protein
MEKNDGMNITYLNPIDSSTQSQKQEIKPEENSDLTKQIKQIKQIFSSNGIEVSEFESIFANAENINEVIDTINMKLHENRYKYGKLLEFSIDDSYIDFKSRITQEYEIAQSIIMRHPSLDIINAEILPSSDSDITKISLTLRDNSKRIFNASRLNNSTS